MVLKAHFLRHLQKKFLKHLLANVHPADTAPGCIVASPSRSEPDYFYHWFRDAALTIGSLLQSSSLGPDAKRNLILDWLSFEAQSAANIDQNAELEGAGEAKVHPSGKEFTEPWGRPQYDSSALRLYYGLQALEILVQQGMTQQADAQFKLVLLRDLNYTCQQIGKASFDIWEECHGIHFFTLASQCSALSSALSCRWLNAELRAQCSAALQKGEGSISAFLNSQILIPSTLKPINCEPTNRGWCDSATLLAVSKFRRSLLLNAKTIRTLIRLVEQFNALYPINHHPAAAPPLLGRYAEDVYFEGNPWVICTCFAIEWCFSASLHLVQHPSLTLEAEASTAMSELYQHFTNLTKESTHARQLLVLGDAWLDRLLHQITSNGKTHSIFKSSLHSAEQIHKESGRWVSAERLTWNYSALLDILRLRLSLEELQSNLL